jgi:hypothetical protein
VAAEPVVTELLVVDAELAVVAAQVIMAVAAEPDGLVFLVNKGLYLQVVPRLQAVQVVLLPLLLALLADYPGLQALAVQAVQK